MKIASCMEASGSLLSSVLLWWLVAASILYLDPVDVWQLDDRLST